MSALLAALLFCSSSVELSPTGDLDALLDGVVTIAKPGVPGPIATFGDEAFVVVTGKDGGGTHLPVVAASRMGKGRVVAFGHGGYFDPGSLDVGQTRRLVHNAVRWAAGKREPRIGGWHVGRLLDDLQAAGFAAERLPGVDLTALEAYDVVVTELAGTDPAQREALGRYLSRGGGLVTSDLGWGWQQLNPNRVLAEDHPANAFLREAGLAYGLGYIGEIDAVRASPEPSFLERAQARCALERLSAGKRETGELSPEELVQLSGTVVHALRSLSAQDDEFLPLVRRAVPKKGRAAVPTGAEPLRADQPLDRLSLILRHRDAQGSPPEEVTASPSAEDFPGAVPRRAPRAAEGSDEARVAIDLGVPGWASTGLYAPPGEAIALRVPERALGLGLYLRIGCHADLLWGKPAWSRDPEICTRTRIGEPVTTMANPHGGLVYVEVPRGLEGVLEVEIPGAALAPLFVLGETDPADWRRRLREPTAPWAELATSRIVLTVPTETARAVSDPTELMRLWHRALGHYAELGARPLDVQPQRFVTDRQISAGYMHAGYPIMTHLDAAERLVNAELLQTERGEWGVWHELGHNHQQGDWTFGGTGEVTCNLFTLFVIEKLSGVPPAKSSHLEGAKRNAAAFLEEGASFERWQRDPFLALVMYVQLQEEFGWELFQEVFAEYRDLSGRERPRTDDEKRDQWLVRLSRAANRDLGPFFERWGVPVTAEARARVAELEDWLPGAK